MKKSFKFIFIVTICLLTNFVISEAQQAGWRGPGRSGVYNETGLMKSWPAVGPALLWESTEVGMGYSSVTVVDDVIYITGSRDGTDYLSALTPEGRKKWEVAYGKIGTKNYQESRCTPTYSNGKLYVISGRGDLACISKEGKLLWTVNHYQKYEAAEQRFGIAESPLVIDNKVIATPAGNKAFMAAFNADNGSVIWETPVVETGAMYASPLLIEFNGVKTIVTYSQKYILGINASDGKVIWKFDYEAVNNEHRGRNHINTPLYRDGFIVAGNGYGQTGAKIKLNPGGDPTLVWKNPLLNPHVGGMILLGNYVYSTTHDNNNMGRWTCTDWNTGETKWITQWKNKGSIIAADGMIYIYEEKDGNVALVRPDPAKLDVVSSFRITKGEGPHWAHMVIDKGRLFVRHGNYLAVFSIKAGK
ncbi:MAG: PQQ-binding-like beta-propeller repeat protein [Bacteroidales bacterium]|nr:PQQ-binding-like beta-propeller repeat protein [Bacteroidales bacterium]